VGNASQPVPKGVRVLSRRRSRYPRLAWATCVGQPATQQQRKLVFSTRDGGRTWRRRGDLTWSGHVWGEPEIDFGGGGAAFAGGGGLVYLSRGAGPARLLKTPDYGRTWVAVHRWP
jgi:hypothetical protein